ncbi:unnamed protein product [Notodromas monacha]|uniref:Glycoside hydrolase family 38 N-terminal domain-containing protein n=1 Tax=Notodromas monacha TaxID=399045 RepID=A0A7R9GHW3_9CRUS|nr:unnamed protein product [Notodromas monacha]CAG0923229.1 unnamed protein product [Notodromas monacha]
MAWTTTSGVCSRRLVLATLGLCWRRGSLFLDPRLLLLQMRWRSGMLGRWLVVVLASLLLAGCLLKNVHDGMALLDGSDDLSLKQQPLQEKQQVEFNWLRLPQHVPVDLTMMNHITDDDDGYKHETASSSTSWRHHVISRKKKKKRKKKEEEEENDNDGNIHDLLEDESAHPQGMLCDSRRAVSIGAVATTDIVAANVFRSFNFTEDRRGPASIWFYKDPFFERRFQETQREIVVDRPTLKVIIMMWSHLDPGWLRTYDDYQNDVNKIYSGFVKRVETYSNISFTTAEVSFFSRFFERCSEEQKEYVRKLVRDGRLEIAAGGWVMADEAAVSLYGMVDQFVQGHSWLDEHLDVAPKSGWSIDPFGHGSAVPYLLSAAGLKQTVIQRIHYQWKDYFARNQGYKWVPGQPSVDQIMVVHLPAGKRQLFQPPARAVLGLANPQPTKPWSGHPYLGWHPNNTL